jgi:hypothetical protein
MDGLVLLSQDKQGQQLCLMERGPFDHHSQRPRCNETSHDSQPLNIYFDGFASVKGVKMGRIVVRKINLDHDAVKTADCRKNG